MARLKTDNTGRVAELMAQGLEMPVIAMRLGMSEGGVRAAAGRIHKKSGGVK